MKWILVGCIGLLCSISSWAQVNLGTIKGVVTEHESNGVPVPFAKVWVETPSGPRGTMTDEAGRYTIDALKPGTYNLTVKSLEYADLKITEIAVNANSIVTVNGQCKSNEMLPEVEIWEPLIVHHDIPKIIIRAEDIKHSLYMRDPKKLISIGNSDIIQLEGTDELIIRGSRPGDAIYYIDGVKMQDLSAIPGVALGGMEAFTGAIPAKYGDTTGGVVVLETKSYFDLYYAWKARQ